jgi:hypothetical protein
MKPSAERRRGLVKNGPGGWGDLETAPSASELLSASDSVETVFLPALARPAARKTLVKQVFQTSIIIRELLVKIFDCVFHFHAISLRNSVRHWLSNCHSKITAFLESATTCR